jgi:CheY-like chemotaxis protein
MDAVVEQERAIEVLLVEDNAGDVPLAQEAFREVNRSIRLHLASDGSDAMAFLRQEGAHLNALRPDFILMDLNLPKMDGREVLGLIKADQSLRLAPTIVLISSATEADVLISYKLQANCYLRKPAQWETFDGLVRSINISG